MIKLGDLSNDELIARLRAHLGRGNVWLASLLAYLAEVDARRLYADYACSSLWDFCVRKLGMSESEAQRRIAAARIIRRFPLARGYIERGAIHLCALYELHKHLTDDNHEELLREASGKSTRVVAEMIAARFPRPDVFPCIEPLAPQPALPLPPAMSQPGVLSSPSLAPSPSAVPIAPQVRPRIEPLSATRYRVELTISAETRAKLERVRDLMRHRNPTGDLAEIFDVAIDLLATKLEKERLGKTSRPKVTSRSVRPEVDDATCAQRDTTMSPLRDDASGAQRADATSAQRADATSAQRVDARTLVTEGVHAPAPAVSPGLDGHPPVSPPDRESGRSDSPAEPGAIGRAAPNTQEQEPTATSATKHAPRPKAVKKKARRRHIPRAVRCEVYARDGEQCTYVDAEGNRCPARGFLELDHIQAKALGGSDEAANLRLRCRAHNHLHAEEVFGRAYVQQQIHLRHRKYVAPLPPSLETASRALRSLGFRGPEVNDVVTRLATTLDPAAPIESILKDALRLLT